MVSHFIATHQFALGIAALWIFSAFVSAFDPPTDKDGRVYRVVYKFLKTIAGDLTLVFGKYLPAAGKAAAAVLVAFLLLAAPAMAQTAPSSSGIPIFGETTASAVHYMGTTYAGTHEVEGINLLNFGANKANLVSVAAHQLLIPGANINIYGFGPGFQPDISSLIAKTNIPKEQFSFAVDGFAGVATLPTGNVTAWEARGIVGYALSPNVALSTAYAGGGMIGNHGFWDITAGLKLTLNPAANPSTLVQKLVAKAAAVKAAKASVR